MTKTKRPTRSRGSTSSRSAAPAELGLFARFCRDALTLEDGRPLKLEAFQRRMLTDLFGGAAETLILLPKKNGKSTILGALALYHLCTTPDAECVIAAASREQAQIMLRQAQGFIRRSPSLEMRLDVKQREIVHRQFAGRIRVMASDVDTADGVIPTLALVDELHRHKSAELYGVFRDGLGPRHGRMVTISTAGARAESPLGALRLKALELPDAEIKGAHRYARTKDGAFVMHEWALRDDDDQDDLKVVKRANPASWQTLAELKQRKESPSTTPWQWARFACGIWVEGEEAWIDPEDWDACAGEPEMSGDCWLGVDIGQVYDSSAVVIACWQGEKLHVTARIWDPRPGRPVEIGEVENYIIDQAKQLRLVEAAYDPFRFTRSAEILEERGLRTTQFPQTDQRMAQASTVLYDLIKDGKVVHDGSASFRKHVLSGVASQTDSGWRIRKKRSKAKIDALVALAMAALRAQHGRRRVRPFVEVMA